MYEEKGKQQEKQQEKGKIVEDRREGAREKEVEKGIHAFHEQKN